MINEATDKTDFYKFSKIQKNLTQLRLLYSELKFEIPASKDFQKFCSSIIEEINFLFYSFSQKYLHQKSDYWDSNAQIIIDLLLKIEGTTEFIQNTSLLKYMEFQNLKYMIMRQLNYFGGQRCEHCLGKKDPKKFDFLCQKCRQK